MDYVRIAVLDCNDVVQGFLDNRAPSANHYFDDELHEYLQGAANTFSFSTIAREETSKLLVVGNKISFKHKDRDYYLNIMHVERNERTVYVESYSLSFELLNENIGEYVASSAMTFAQYLAAIDPEKTLTLGTNEVSDKKITYAWTGESTVLARLFSLATVFSAEIEFVAVLNTNYSLKQITLNVYKEHSDTTQGVGENKTGVILRYGVDISGITKKSDVTDLYTCIKLTGKNGLTVSSLNKTENDRAGNIEYRSASGDAYVRAVQARDRFPSNLMNKNDRYIARYGTYDTDNVNVLYGQALALLKKNCTPLVEYEVEGYVDTAVGDTLSIEDSEYKPVLYLEARVSEQVRSFTAPSKNKTTFSNFVEKQSEISPELLSRMQAMIDAHKTYTCSIITNNGIVFKNGAGSTILTASMMDIGKDVTDSFSIIWYKDGVSIGTGKNVTVNALSIVEKAVYKFEASDSDGIIRGFYEVTVSNVEDGTQGIPGAVGGDGKTSYIHIAYANDDTGTIGFSLTDSSGKLYIGQYTDFTQPDSSDPAKYKWTKVKGDDGDPGETGQGTESITKEYYRSTSSTDPVGGSWSNTPPTWVTGSYLWERWKTVYKNPSETEYSTAVLNADWGDANSKITDVQQTLTDEGIVTLISESLANGQEISTTKFIMSALGLLIKNGGLTIQNNAGEVVFNADDDGNISFKGTLSGASGSFLGSLIAYNANGKKLMETYEGRINFYDGRDDIVAGYIDSDLNATMNNLRLNGTEFLTLMTDGDSGIGLGKAVCNIYKPIRYRNSMYTMPRIYSGSYVTTISNSDSIQVISSTTINSLFSISNSNSTNTALYVANGDAGTASVHFEGASYLDGVWYATLNRFFTGDVRVNYTVLCWA